MRRSLFAICGLFAGLVGVLVVVTIALDLPPVLPAVVAIALTLLQWAIGPWLIERLVPATTVPLDDVDLDVASIVRSACERAGVRPVRLGVIDDGSPNAFVFGRTRRSARLYVSRGLLERLDHDEVV